MQRYIGRVATILPNERNGFIGLSSVTAEDGSAHNLQTSHDIYVHQDDCGSTLRQGMQVIFEVTPDQRRRGDNLRAVDVEHHFSQELVLVGGDSGGSRALADPKSLYVPPTPAQRGLMKPVAPEAVEQVLVNKPMPMVPRTSERVQNAAEITNRLMQRLFPQLSAIVEESGADSDDKFDKVIQSAIEDHKALGMEAQAARMLGQANLYKGLRIMLRSEEDLLRPEAIIPIQYLPDLFMAVPVWYFWADDKTRREAANVMKEQDPKVHPTLRHFCDLVPNQRWADTFLMFNRRMRTLADYQGDIIPPRIIARMRKLANLFDYMVIMTPYHDVAGRDWEDLNWLRSIDPYVVGFTNGIPLMFVVGRFSDSGTFPLYSELVADTIAFLRSNITKLRGFNKVSNPYWYLRHGKLPYDGNSWDGQRHENLDNDLSHCVRGLGTQLEKNTRQLLVAFDSGNLFDWLRGYEDQLPARA